MIVAFKTLPIFQPMYETDARYIGLAGGRDSAKSHQAAQYVLTRCAMRPGSRWLGVREYQTALRESAKKLLEDKIREHRLERFGFEILRDFIRTPGGGQITFTGMQSHNAESIKSYEGLDGVFVEEARSLSARSFEMLRPTIRKTGSKVVCVWNPEGAEDPVEELFRRPASLPGGGILIRANWRDNLFISDESLEEIVHMRDNQPRLFRHVYEGEYHTKEGLVFDNWRVAEYADPLWPNVPQYRYGADWGFGPDPSVLVRSWRAAWVTNEAGTRYPHYSPKGDLLVIDREAWALRARIDDLPAIWAGDCPSDYPPHKRWLNADRHPGVDGVLKSSVIADSSGPEIIRKMQDYGFIVYAAKKPEGSVLQGVKFLQNFAEILIDPRCVHTIDEFKNYAWRKDPRTQKSIYPAQLEDKKNHVIDSVRYAWEGESLAARTVFG